MTMSARALYTDDVCIGGAAGSRQLSAAAAVFHPVGSVPSLAGGQAWQQAACTKRGDVRDIGSRAGLAGGRVWW